MILWAECEHQGGADDRCDAPDRSGRAELQARPPAVHLDLADLVPQHNRLADDLATGLSVQLDASTDGQSYLAEVSRDLLSTVRARSGTKLTAHSCLVLKSGSGVNCPP